MSIGRRGYNSKSLQGAVVNIQPIADSCHGCHDGELKLTLVSLDGRLQVLTLAGLLAAIALYVGGARLSHGTAVSALRHGPALLVDVL